MADRSYYPQIPSTVWWGVRSLLNRIPTVKIDERLLGVEFKVQESAAKAYIKELRLIGILNDDFKATELAHKWRLDDTYTEAVDEIVRRIYPDTLIAVAPPGDAERQKVVSWFQREGLGTGAAGNKAATYLLLSSPSPNEAPRTGPKATPSEPSPRDRLAQRKPKRASQVSASSTAYVDTPPALRTERKPTSPEAYPLNINIQIHIGADAGSEQIDSIFQAMRRYLYDTPGS